MGEGYILADRSPLASGVAASCSFHSDLTGEVEEEGGCPVLEGVAG